MSETHNVTIDAEGLRNLLTVAVRTGTIQNWAAVALQWIDGANAEIADLRAKSAAADADVASLTAELARQNAVSARIEAERDALRARVPYMESHDDADIASMGA